MADKTSEHRHCPACGKSMGTQDRFCSPDCEKSLVGQRKRQQRTTWIIMGVLVLFMVLIYTTQGQAGCLGAAPK